MGIINSTTHQNYTAETIATGNAQVQSTGNENSTFVNASHSQKDDYQKSTGQGEPSTQKAIKLINQISYERTYTEVTEGYQTENISEPESSFIVFPQIAEVPKFYKGISEENSSFECDLEALQKNKEQQYFKERLFTFGQLAHKTLSFKDLLELITNSKNKPKQDTIGIFSQAGSGKTTIMKRAAAAIMEQSGITSKYGVQSIIKSRSELVIYGDFKSIDPKSETTLKEVLFSQYLKDDEAELLYDWVMKNQSNVSLFLDGYDQAYWTITESDTDKTLGPRQKSSTQTIMGNLLSKKLLPKVSIIISSRQFKAASLPCEARPKQILTLLGFSDLDAEMLFNKLVSISHQIEQPKTATKYQMEVEFNEKQNNDKSNPWKTLHSNSSLLHSFLRIPVFLIFAAIIFTSNISIPSTVTGMIFQILQLLHSAKIVQQQKCLPEIIKKLKRLAYEGTVGGYVLFKPEHFKKHNLKIEEVSDLLIGTPKNKCLNQRFMESDFFLFFCHQSIQEFLSAWFIAEMDLEDFQNFVENNIHQPRWSVVRRFVFGIVYNLNDVSIINHEQKKTILRKSLTSEVVEVKKYELLEILQTLFESNDNDLIKSHIHGIDLAGTPLGTNEVKLLSYILSRCPKIDCLNLWGCELNDELIRILKNVKVSITSLDLQRNQIPFTALNCFLNNLQIRELKLSNDHISGEGGLNWKNVLKVRVEVMYNSMFFANERDSIKVNTKRFNGIFNKYNKTLEIEDGANEYDETVLLCIAATEKFLQPTSVNFNNNITFLKQQYLEYEALEKMLKWNFNLTVPKVVLNCRNAPKISPSVIRSFKEKYQVDVLDIAVRIHQSSIGENFYEESTSIKIHVWERVKDQTGIKDLATNLKENKADNLTIVPYYKYAPATEDIVMLINSCQSKALTLVYDEDDNGMKDLDRSRLMEAAESSSVKLNLRTRRGLPYVWRWLFLEVSLYG